MDQRPLGTTPLQVSVLGFGCGAVGGLLVRGDAAERSRAVARAIDLGVTYFDTAAAYGSGASETNLGMALKELGPSAAASVIVGTKIRLRPEDRPDIAAAVRRLIDQSLHRLGRDSVDLMQLHNLVGDGPGSEPDWLTPADVAQVLAAFETARDAGKLRFWGINGLGDIDALHRCLGMKMHSIQICHSLLNPTAGFAAPPGFPFDDQRLMIDAAARQGIGILAFRLLAGGALSGSADRHANAMAQIDTILSTDGFDHDVQLAQRFRALVAAGHAESLIELAIRFGAGTTGVSSAIIGFSTIEQLEEAARFTMRGPLPDAVQAAVEQVWSTFGTP